LIYNKLMYENELPHRAVAVYLYLRDRADKNGRCFPSVSTIGRELKLSQRTIYRALIDLEKAWFVEKETRWRQNGGRSSTLYTILK